MPSLPLPNAEPTPYLRAQLRSHLLRGAASASACCSSTTACTTTCSRARPSQARTRTRAQTRTRTRTKGARTRTRTRTRAQTRTRTKGTRTRTRTRARTRARARRRRTARVRPPRLPMLRRGKSVSKPVCKVKKDSLPRRPRPLHDTTHLLTCLLDSRQGGDGLRHGRGRRPRTARAAGGQVHRHGALHAPLPRVPARPDRPGGGGRARQGLGAHQLLRVQVNTIGKLSCRPRRLRCCSIGLSTRFCGACVRWAACCAIAPL